jgi:GT2 family glycosyltransferase
MKLSVVLPTLNREEALRRTLAALVDQLTSEMELIVVDQSESHEPETDQALKGEQVQLVKEAKKSAAHARNVGLERARGEVVLFLDDDLEIPRNFLQAHRENYTDERVDAVVGSIYTPSEPEADIDGPGRVTFYGRFRRNLMYAHRAEAEAGGSGNISVRTSAAREIGGWDEGFIGNDKWGDVDFCFRLRQAGYRIMYDPAARVTHLHEASGGARSTRSWRSYYYEVYYNDARFFWRHRLHRYFPVYLLAQVSKLIILSVRPGTAVFPIPRNPLTTLAGLVTAAVSGTWNGIRRSW